MNPTTIRNINDITENIIGKRLLRETLTPEEEQMLWWLKKADFFNEHNHKGLAAYAYGKSLAIEQTITNHYHPLHIKSRQVFANIIDDQRIHQSAVQSEEAYARQYLHRPIVFE